MKTYDEKKFPGGLVVGETDKNGGKGVDIVAPEGRIKVGGGEFVVVSDAGKAKEKYEFEGEKKTPCEIVSDINHKYGGVKIPCDIAEAANTTDSKMEVGDVIKRAENGMKVSGDEMLDELNNAVSKYGWAAKAIKTGKEYELINRLNKSVADVKIPSGGRYAFYNKGGEKILTGRGQLGVSAERVATGYFYANPVAENGTKINSESTEDKIKRLNSDYNNVFSREGDSQYARLLKKKISFLKSQLNKNTMKEGGKTGEYQVKYVGKRYFVIYKFSDGEEMVMSNSYATEAGAEKAKERIMYQAGVSKQGSMATGGQIPDYQLKTFDIANDTLKAIKRDGSEGFRSIYVSPREIEEAKFINSVRYTDKLSKSDIEKLKGIKRLHSSSANFDYLRTGIDEHGLTEISQATRDSMYGTKILYDGAKYLLDREGIKMASGGAIGDDTSYTEITQTLWPQNTMSESEKVKHGKDFVNKYFDGQVKKAYSEIVLSEQGYAYGGKTKIATKNFYRLFGGLLADKSIFNPFIKEELMEWTLDKKLAQKRFDEAGLNSFDKEALEEYEDEKDYGLLFELHEVKIPETEWIKMSFDKSLTYSDSINEYYMYHGEIIDERAIDLRGKPISKDKLKKLLYAEGGQIHPLKKVKANQGIAISEVLKGFPEYRNLSPLEASFLYNLRNKDVAEESFRKRDGLSGSMFKNLDEKGYLGYNYDKWNPEFTDWAYEISDDGWRFIQRVDNRLETRKGVKRGVDLFPETSNIPELSMAGGGQISTIIPYTEFITGTKANIDLSESRQDLGMELARTWAKDNNRRVTARVIENFSNDVGAYHRVRDVLEKIDTTDFKDVVKVFKELYPKASKDWKSALRTGLVIKAGAKVGNYSNGEYIFQDQLSESIREAGLNFLDPIVEEIMGGSSMVGGGKLSDGKLGYRDFNQAYGKYYATEHKWSSYPRSHVMSSIYDNYVKNPGDFKYLDKYAEKEMAGGGRLLKDKYIAIANDFDGASGYSARLLGTTSKNGDKSTGEFLVEDNSIFFTYEDSKGNPYNSKEEPAHRIDMSGAVSSSERPRRENGGKAEEFDYNVKPEIEVTDKFEKYYEKNKTGNGKVFFNYKCKPYKFTYNYGPSYGGIFISDYWDNHLYSTAQPELNTPLGSYLEYWITKLGLSSADKRTL